MSGYAYAPRNGSRGPNAYGVPSHGFGRSAGLPERRPSPHLQTNHNRARNSFSHRRSTTHYGITPEIPKDHDYPKIFPLPGYTLPPSERTPASSRLRVSQRSPSQSPYRLTPENITRFGYPHYLDPNEAAYSTRQVAREYKPTQDRVPSLSPPHRRFDIDSELLRDPATRYADDFVHAMEEYETERSRGGRHRRPPPSVFASHNAINGVTDLPAREASVLKKKTGEERQQFKNHPHQRFGPIDESALTPTFTSLGKRRASSPPLELMRKKRPGFASASLSLSSVDDFSTPSDNRYGEPLANAFGDHDQSGRFEKTTSDRQMQPTELEEMNKTKLLLARLAQNSISAPHPQSSFESGEPVRDWQMELMLHEQQNKKRLLQARQEQDNMSVSHPGSGPGSIPAMSPQGKKGAIQQQRCSPVPASAAMSDADFDLSGVNIPLGMHQFGFPGQMPQGPIMGRPPTQQKLAAIQRNGALAPGIMPNPQQRNPMPPPPASSASKQPRAQESFLSQFVQAPHTASQLSKAVDKKIVVKDTQRRKTYISAMPTPSQATGVTQELYLGRQPVKPAIYMRYTISEDMSQCTEAQEKKRLIAVHDRRSPFISKRCGLLPNSADRARKSPEDFLNQAPTAEFNEKLEQQRKNRMYYPDVHAHLSY